MNDVEKAFAKEDEELEELRAWANEHLPRLGELVNKTKDPKFIAFMQYVVDSFMMHECRLGRIHKKNQYRLVPCFHNCPAFIPCA